MEKMQEILPFPFIERMKLTLKGETDDFFSSLDQESPVSFRVNPGKFPFNPPLVRVPWCSTGFYLPHRPLFTLDPLWHAGAYYVQEPSSMFLEHVFRQVAVPDAPLLVLDLCGAPGGKSTHLLSLMNSDSLLVANEVIRSRAAILAENIRKWGHSNVIVTTNDPGDFAAAGRIFDIVVVDAPCSGEGLFRKDRNSIPEWSVENTSLCAARQKRILSEGWECLKPGGYLIYSTCTFNPDENENNLNWIAEQKEATSISLPDLNFAGVQEIVYRKIKGYRFMPHRVRGEGFFIGVLQRTDGKISMVSGKRKSGFQLLSQIQKKRAESWLLPKGNQVLLQYRNQLVLFKNNWLEHLDFLHSRLKLTEFGCPMAEETGNVLNLLHGFAVSTEINQGNFENIDFTLQQAVNYLKRETFPVDSKTKGWILVTYKQIPLGWIKNLGNRFYNHYPSSWRIRMAANEIPSPWHEW